MESILKLQPPLFCSADKAETIKPGDYTPSKANTPIYAVIDPLLKIPIENIDIYEIARRIQAFVQFNGDSIIHYVEPAKNKSTYLMENGMLYKTHIILHDNLNSMTFVNVEVFMSRTSREYMVEIVRMRGSNNLYGHFYRGIRNAILTGDVGTKTIVGQKYEEMGNTNAHMLSIYGNVASL